MQCAYLHDTLEDTKATYYDLLKYFGPQVAGIVLELTSEEDIKKELGKERYLSIRMKDMTSWALSIKLCDRLDNISDLEYGGEEFKERYVAETLGILNYLIDRRKMSHSQLLIIKKILNIISNTQVHDKYKDSKVRDIFLKTNIADSLITNPGNEKKLILC
jgi:(p)ppGpp synthase/HD superfamily hydrolase